MATPPRQPRYRGCLPAFLWINILLLVSPCSFPNCEAFQSRDIQTTFPITRAATVRPCSTPRLKSPSLLRANNNSDEYLEAETPELDSKEQLSMAYTAAKYLFGGTAVLHLITARPAAMFPAADFARSTEWGAAAGFGIAAGICNILKGANRADRLASDTYKRLSIGLIGFCAIGLVAVPGEAAFVALPGNAAVVFTVGVRMLGLAVASVGWKRGVVFVEGTKTHSSAKAVLAKISKAAKGLRVQNERKALTYRNCFLLVVAGMTSNFMEFIFDLRYQQALGRTWYDASLQLSAVARLFLIGTMIFSLKDAAERDRLTGTTFIQLNRLVGAWAVAVAAGQMVTVESRVVLGRGVEMAGFGAWFFLKAWKSVREKNNTVAGSD